MSSETTDLGRRETSTGENASKGRASLKPLLALKPLILAHKGALWGAAIAVVMSAVAMLAVPMAVRRMIDNGFGSHDSHLINSYFLTLIGIGLLLAIASPARFYFVNWIGERVVADLRTKVFAQLSTLGPAYFDVNHSGEIMSRLTADTTQIKAVAGSSLSQAARNFIMLIGALVMMFVSSAKLSLLVFIAIPVIVLPLVGFGRLVRRLSRTAQDTLGDASAYAAENLAAHRTMLAYVNEKAVTARFSSVVERAFDAARQRMRARAALTGVAIFLTVASVTGVLWYGASDVISGNMTAGRLGQFVLYALFAAGALAELSEVWGEITQAAGAAERLSEMMATIPEIRSPEKPVPLPQPPLGTVAFENVTFSYATRRDEKALDGVSFNVKPGETIALVGPSGSGKSTIFNLLLRFYDPSAGRVDVDGVNVADADLAELRGRLALVPQDVALFADTVAENIRYGTPNATLADIRQAAIAAQADGFISALPGGYDCKLGERGALLSGGQRQRIAIARAILKNAPILLLDEATSALDAESEHAVQHALDGLVTDRTTLVIAHRLATVQKADRILVMEKGRIVEAGTHAELVRRNGTYARLAELQFGREAAE
ncbi:lipid A ABC exporter family, fused ATPase and inner membrane subunits [Hyphomicrobium denitrificans ATCC 51888]|uniref:Lipid A ABC exporter family, fused ATPase and inner membrane subunits n=1 Tax=Hyphomicrobium denitrificans (strain ATCC 51888 / DSM 1869 / NCIMB 11706 / TK 0415) TaxID=582899 RepID=D8JSF7_HYPDA|nr:ABC transporter transmembrane domain-containing protein [Hyphomicrobium denitrificans]ADJ24251.1 lipid A ABC exporter family, fused ATPase and inner membrane subunits [Hyphomicrobium denitrificans ATCC 51888]